MGNSTPKIIHCCWLGNNPKPDLVKKCIASWKKVLPDWQIMEWSEENSAQVENNFFKKALQYKKWAFAADYLRLWVLNEYGGIYLDTDMEVIKPLDKFLEHNFFIGIESFSSGTGSSIIGAAKGHFIIKDLLELYEKETFIKPNGRYNLKPINARIRKYFKKKLKYSPKKMQNAPLHLAEGIFIYPGEYFYPLEYIKSTENTCTIHYYANSWGEDWGTRTWINSSKYALHLFKKHNKSAVELPLLENEKLCFSIKLSAIKVLAVVRKG